VGFPIYTMAVLTGILWMYRLPSEGFRIEYLLAGVIWAIFCALIVMRVTVGVSGRRAAVLTLVGFAVTALVLFVYVGRRLAAG